PPPLDMTEHEATPLPDVRTLGHEWVNRFNAGLLFKTGRIRSELNKGVCRREEGYDVGWHIYTDAEGSVRVSQPLIDASDAAGIPVYVHNFPCECL
ncbi:MAG: hypothetical protein ACREMY_25430, partial [bacterium]